MNVPGAVLAPGDRPAPRPGDERSRRGPPPAGVGPLAQRRRGREGRARSAEAGGRRGRLALAAAVAALAAGCGASPPEVEVGPGQATRLEGDGPDAGAAVAPEDQPQVGSSREYDVADKRCDDSHTEPEEETLDRIRAAVHCLVNAERRERGLQALRPDPALRGAAQRKAEDMAARDYFAHVGPDGRTVEDWVRGTGYLPQDGGWTLGENIAWSPDGAATPASIVESWMASATHRRNLLDGKFADSGVGVTAAVPRADATAGATYTHFLGSHRPPG